MRIVQKENFCNKQLVKYSMLRHFNHDNNSKHFVLIFFFVQMALSPAFRNPITDLTGCMINYQGSKCAQFEMNMMECYEVYGVDRGGKMCKELIEDFQECTGLDKQMLRVEVVILCNT